MVKRMQLKNENSATLYNHPAAKHHMNVCVINLPHLQAPNTQITKKQRN